MAERNLKAVTQETGQTAAPLEDGNTVAGDLCVVVTKLCELQGMVDQCRRGDSTRLADVCAVISEALQARIDELNAISERAE